MEFRIADTFTESLAKLTRQEQKAVKMTAFDLQVNPANPGMSFHKIGRARDTSFFSVRVSQDIRLIVHRSSNSLLLCYVDHHDEAYRWAERRKVEVHPKTGAAQLVEIRETVREIPVPKYIEVEQPPPPKAPLFAGMTDEELLAYGVPGEWIDDVRQADEDTVLDLADHLPHEAAEALLELATGGQPHVAPPPVTPADPFEHPDAQRRFRVMKNADELQRALEYPWEKWGVFLHPAQREIVEHSYNGPARVSGSAGTGKTVVALHRAAFLARAHAEARVLLTTFSETLADALKVKLRVLVGNEPRVFERIEAHSIVDVAFRLHRTCLEEPRLAGEAVLRALLAEAAKSVPDHRFSERFVWTEWDEVVDAWQLDSWEAYRDVARLGRKKRLGEKQREQLWQIFEQARAALEAKQLLTRPGMFARITEHLEASRITPYDYAVVDEAQDIGVPQLRFLAALGTREQDGLFFAGDLGQRIFQPPFSWKSLGVDVRGRSRTLWINYRTSHQIRQHADRLLPPELADVDGLVEDRRGTISVFNGPPPAIHVFDSEDLEIEAVAAWLSERRERDLLPHELGVFVRSAAELPRAKAAVTAAGLQALELRDTYETKSDHVSICTMHLAKGLEYRAVVVMACDDEILPLQERIENVGDEADLEEVYNTERHLLYVACTRARDHLLVTSVDPASEFLDDLRG